MGKAGFKYGGLKEDINVEEEKKDESSKNNLDERVYEDPVLQACYDAGYLGLDKQYLIVALSIPEKVIREQFSMEEGDFYFAYLKGYYTALTKLRKQIMCDALEGSSTAQQKMLYYLSNIDKELNNE